MTYEDQFKYWYDDLKASREINTSPDIEEITEWWEEKIRQTQLQTEDSVYKQLRDKVVTLSGGMPVIHADYLETIKTRAIYCDKHKTQFEDLITKRCPRCRTATVAPLNELNDQHNN